MADWVKIYEKAEDMHQEMLDRLVAEMKAEASSQGAIGTTTMSNGGPPEIGPDFRKEQES